MWTLQQIVQALLTSAVAGTSEAELSLPLFDQERTIGVGIDKNRHGILLLPGYEDLAAFSTNALQFDPWCEVVWLEQQITLQRCAVLRCNFAADDPDELRVVAGILHSLIDLQETVGDAGRAIWKLRELFENGFNNEPPRSTIIGLLGEMVWIAAHGDPAAAVRTWHLDAQDRYDFSWDSHRIEVKTTIGTVREHSFTSRQLPASAGTDVTVVSVLLKVVADGISLADLYRELSERVEYVDRKKLSDVILDVAGIPPQLISEPLIDLEGTLADIAAFDSSDVPTPTSLPGVIEVEWRAFLDQQRALPEINQVQPTRDGSES